MNSQYIEVQRVKRDITWTHDTGITRKCLRKQTLQRHYRGIIKELLIMSGIIEALQRHYGMNKGTMEE